MLSRRTFLGSGVAVAALGAGVTETRGTAAATIGAVIVDANLAPAQAFGAAARRLALPVHAFRDDAGSVWMNLVEPQLRARHITLAGLVGPASLFALEYLARDHGLGTVYRIEHATSRSGSATHTLTGDARLAPLASTLACAGRHWPVAAAVALRDAACGTANRTLPLIDVADCRAETVFSFLLA